MKQEKSTNNISPEHLRGEGLTVEDVDYVTGAVLAQMEDLPLHKKQEVLADIIADLFPEDYVVWRSGEGEHGPEDVVTMRAFY